MGILSRFFGVNIGGDAVAHALDVPEVQEALTALGRNGVDLRELQDRLVRSGVERVNIPTALRNVALLTWFFSLPDTNKISQDDSLRLMNWARYGNPAGPP